MFLSDFSMLHFFQKTFLLLPKSKAELFGSALTNSLKTLIKKRDKYLSPNFFRLIHDGSASEGQPLFLK